MYIVYKYIWWIPLQAQPKVVLKSKTVVGCCRIGWIHIFEHQSHGGAHVTIICCDRGSAHVRPRVAWPPSSDVENVGGNKVISWRTQKSIPWQGCLNRQPIIDVQIWESPFCLRIKWQAIHTMIMRFGGVFPAIYHPGWTAFYPNTKAIPSELLSISYISIISTS